MATVSDEDLQQRLAKQGATLKAIMRQGRWHHEGTVNGYIEEGTKFEANAAGAILEKIEN